MSNEPNKQAIGKNTVVHPNEIISQLKQAINEFLKENHRREELSIYCPIWYREILLNVMFESLFIPRAEPLHFLGVKFVEGYENAIILANANSFKAPSRDKKIRIEILL